MIKCILDDYARDSYFCSNRDGSKDSGCGCNVDILD